MGAFVGYDLGVTLLGSCCLFCGFFGPAHFEWGWHTGGNGQLGGKLPKHTMLDICSFRTGQAARARPKNNSPGVGVASLRFLPAFLRPLDPSGGAGVAGWRGRAASLDQKPAALGTAVAAPDAGAGEGGASERGAARGARGASAAVAPVVWPRNGRIPLVVGGWAGGFFIRRLFLGFPKRKPTGDG